jgi:hypothetical protein
MANQKTTDFRRLTADQVAAGDLFGIVDVSERATSPTGENKTIIADDLAQFIVDNYASAGSRFTLQYTTSASGWWDDSHNNVLPDGYVITSIVVETTESPIISLGTSNYQPVTGSSITGSWCDNRVYPTNASYSGKNYLEVYNYGAVHHLRTVYVQFYNTSGVAVDNGSLCTFTIDGFTI